MTEKTLTIYKPPTVGKSIGLLEFAEMIACVDFGKNDEIAIAIVRQLSDKGIQVIRMNTHPTRPYEVLERARANIAKLIGQHMKELKNIEPPKPSKGFIDRSGQKRKRKW